jgi:hypothetical protein
MQMLLDALDLANEEGAILEVIVFDLLQDLC